MSVPEQPGPVLSFEDARHSVEEHARGIAKPKAAAVALKESLGRVLAEDILADRDQPPFPRATRDGYAVRSADLAKLPATLRVVGQIKAGSALDAKVGSIEPGCCAEIMTGAPAPAGADSVVMVEFTRADGASVQVERATRPGENIVPTGSEAKAGQLLVPRGTRLGYAQMALAAAVGKAEVEVFARPRVAILSTGDEVVEVSAQPGAYQIRNSNGVSLAAQVTAAGGEAVLLPIAPDELTRLRQLIEEGLKADLLLLSGGVSMGKFDLVETVLRELGAEFFFTGAHIQPGKPIVFGRTRGKYFFGLPGNPISTMVTFGVFARTMIEALGGAAPVPLRFAQARLQREVKTKPGLTRFLPAVLSGPHADPQVELVGWQGSGDIASMARANCFLVVPPDRESFAAGERISILLQ